MRGLVAGCRLGVSNRQERDRTFPGISQSEVEVPLNLMVVPVSVDDE